MIPSFHYSTIWLKIKLTPPEWIKADPSGSDLLLVGFGSLRRPNKHHPIRLNQTGCL